MGLNVPPAPNPPWNPPYVPWNPSPPTPPTPPPPPPPPPTPPTVNTHVISHAVYGDSQYPWISNNPYIGFPYLAGTSLPASDTYNYAASRPGPNTTPSFGGVQPGVTTGTAHNNNTGAGGVSVNFSDFDGYIADSNVNGSTPPLARYTVIQPSTLYLPPQFGRNL